MPDIAQRYPISGRIGLDEVIDQYIVIQKRTKLSAAAEPSAQTYKSVITFTTTIEGSLKPSITVTRASGQKFSGSSTLMGQRQDIHEVTVVLVPPPSTKSPDADQVVNVRILNSETLIEDAC